MFVKRAAQLKLLEDQYASPGNNLVILYGRKGMGKTQLLSEFLKEKQGAYYYEGMECDGNLQLLLMNRKAALEEENAELLDYAELFFGFIGRNTKKTIIVLDEFHYIIKNNPDFTKAFRLLSNPNRPVMFILSSSSIRWVENEMVSGLGSMSHYITAYLKLKELTFVDFVNCFPKSSVETCIHINAILGGIPEYLGVWQENYSVRENLEQYILNKGSRLFMSPQQLLKLELREPAVYNTILFELASGNRKLNDLHVRTGYTRAKIIVYLKHLIQLDIVEKLVPLSEAGKENVQKGLYRIRDNYFHFWYRFIFPNLSELMLGNTSAVYETQVEPYLNDYLQEYFADVCTEYLKLMNLQQKFNDKFLWWDRWYGKNGTIDIMAESEKGETLIGRCFWEDRKAEPQDYDRLVALAHDAGKTPAYCYIFSKAGFSDKLRDYIPTTGNTVLISLDEF